MIAAFLPLLAILLSAADSVRAHGYIEDVTVAGKKYPGWHPFVDPYVASPPVTVVRHVRDDGPVLDVHSGDLACSVAGHKGTGKAAEANAGDKITFHWNQWLDDHLGPVTTYMADCNNDCTNFDAASGKWFKIDAAGYDSKKKQWASDVVRANGNTWTSTIPASLAPGQYLVRHEIVALHDASQPQFYPSCTQVKIKQGGNAKPSGSQTVSIPGIYDNFRFPDIWSDGFNSFTVAGPPEFGNGDNNVQPVNNVGPAPPPPSSVAPPPSSTRSPSATPSKLASTPSKPTSTPNKPAAPTTTAVAAPPSYTGRCRRNTRRGEPERMARRHVGFSKRHH